MRRPQRRRHRHGRRRGAPRSRRLIAVHLAFPGTTGGELADTLFASELTARRRGGRSLRAYGRAVWGEARDAAFTWRRAAAGAAAIRAAGEAEGLWWGAVDGAFESRGGVLDLCYRAHVLAAVLDDHAGTVTAEARDGDPWLEVLRLLCRARSRHLVERVTARLARARTLESPLRRAQLLARRAAGSVARPRRADVLAVLAHGPMAQLADGLVADRYTADMLPALGRELRVAVVSLEPPAHQLLPDLRGMLTGGHVPWLAYVSLLEIVRSRDSRAAWEQRLSAGQVGTLVAAGVDLSPVMAVRALPLAARGLALMELYRLAFGRAIAATRPRAAVTVEAHANVGRAMRLAAPALPLFAPQGGLITTDASLNSAYDHRGLNGLSVDDLTGCPWPTRSLVWGPFYASLLERLGHTATDIAVSGLPRNLPEPVESGDEIVFVAGSSEDVCAFAADFDEEVATIETVRAYAARARRRLVVRLHPAHRAGRYRAALPGDVEVRDGSRPLARGLERAALVVGKASTALVEAAAAGLPVAVVDLGPAPDLAGFASAGLPVATDESDVNAALEGADADRSLGATASLAAPSGAAAVQRVVAEVARACGSAVSEATYTGGP